jgi:hypothetical protein
MKRTIYNSNQMPQRSQEWHVARMSKFTSSQIYQLFVLPTKKEIEQGECFSKGAKTYILQKAGELLFPSREITGSSHAMERGLELEPQAIEAYLKLKKAEKQDVSFVTLGEETASSPDLVVIEHIQERTGDFSHENGGAEFKCRSQINHLKAIKYLKTEEDVEKLHNKEWWQCQHQIYVCDLDWIDYVHYHPDLDTIYDPIQDKRIDSAYKHKALHIVRIHRDEKTMKEFEEIIPLAAKLRNQYLKELLE